MRTNIGKEIAADLDRLRHQQSERVMPLIGPLLDAWDAVPNDLKYELTGFDEMMAALNTAMEQ